MKIVFSSYCNFATFDETIYGKELCEFTLTRNTSTVKVIDPVNVPEIAPR